MKTLTQVKSMHTAIRNLKRKLETHGPVRHHPGHHPNSCGSGRSFSARAPLAEFSKENAEVSLSQSTVALTQQPTLEMGPPPNEKSDDSSDSDSDR